MMIVLNILNCISSDVTPTVRHEDFRLFACMNPATDVGKKDLPPGIRNRFVNVMLTSICDSLFIFVSKCPS